MALVDIEAFNRDVSACIRSCRAGELHVVRVYREGADLDLNRFAGLPSGTAHVGYLAGMIIGLGSRHGCEAISFAAGQCSASALAASHQQNAGAHKRASLASARNIHRASRSYLSGREAKRFAGGEG